MAALPTKMFAALPLGKKSTTESELTESERFDKDSSEFKYEKNTCALSYWHPIKLLEEGSISDIHLVVRRSRPIKVRYKDKRDVMAWAKKHGLETINKDEKDTPNDEDLYVLKSIMKDHVGRGTIMNEMRAEIHNLSFIDHPNIVKLYEAYERRRHVYLVLEYCSGGTLADRIATKKCSEQDVAVIMKKILDAVAYLHSKNIAHRDIKLENCMFDMEGEIKIIDLGLATKYLSDDYQVMTDKVGTLYSMAPEVLAGNYTEKCDLWSIGVVAYLLLSGGQQPFWGPPRSMPWGERRQVMMERIQKCEYQKMIDPKWEGISPEAKDFVRALLKLDPDSRLTAAEALNHPWIQELGTEYNLSPNDEQAAIRTEFKRNLWYELSTKLSLDDIMSLQATLESEDEQGDARVRIDTLRSILEEEVSSLSKSDINELFCDERLDTTNTINYVNLVARILAGKGRNFIEDLARALDDLDVEGERKVKRDGLDPLIQNMQLSDPEERKLWSNLEVDSDGYVSTSHLLEIVGKVVAKKQRDSIRTGSKET